MRLLLCLVLAAGAHALEEPLPGPDSPSTAYVARQLAKWRPVELTEAAPIALACLLTAEQPETVGLRQDMLIAAPLAEVAGLVDDYAHYPQLFPDLTDVHVVPGSADGNRYLVAWEQAMPVFFLPSIRYQTTWVVERKPGRITYRYKLLEKGTVRATDGFIVLEAMGERTRYSELDFIDADSGPVPMATVWALTLDGFFRSDVALKLKAEQPARSYLEVKAAAEKLLVRFPTLGCFEKRHPRAP